MVGLWSIGTMVFGVGGALTSPNERPDALRRRLTPLVEIGLGGIALPRWEPFTGGNSKKTNGPYKPGKPGKPGRMPQLVRPAFVPDGCLSTEAILLYGPAEAAIG